MDWDIMLCDTRRTIVHSTVTAHFNCILVSYCERGVSNIQVAVTNFLASDPSRQVQQVQTPCMLYRIAHAISSSIDSPLRAITGHAWRSQIFRTVSRSHHGPPVQLHKGCRGSEPFHPGLYGGQSTRM